MSLPLVLVNGWAMSEVVLAPLVEVLPDIDITIINLSDIVVSPTCSLNNITCSLDSLLPNQPFILAGWSYGATLACAYASTFPNNLRALVTLAMNPCFVATEDWQSAMHPAVFNQFLIQSQLEPEKMLRQFSLLCSMGSENHKALRQRLKHLLKVDRSMVRMLKILGLSDIRRQLITIDCPITHCYGLQDALIPSDVIEKVKLSFNLHQVNAYAGGHCFFIEKPDALAILLKRYCQGGSVIA